MQQRPSSCPAGLTLLGPGRTSGSLPFLSAAEQRGLPDPPRPGTSPHRPPEVGSGTRTRPTRPRLRTAAGTGGGGRTVATRSGWRPGVCPGLPARGRFARPSVARRRPGTGAGPSALGPAGRRGGPPRPAPYLGSGSEWLCSVALSAAARFFPPPAPCGHWSSSASGWATAGPGLRLSPGLPQARLRWLHCAPITPLIQDGGAPRTGFPLPLSTGAGAAQRWAREAPPQPIAEAERRSRHASPPAGRSRAGKGGRRPPRAPASPGRAPRGRAGKRRAGRGGRACPLSFSEAAPPPRVLAPQGGHPRVKALALRKTSGFSQLFVVEK